MNKKNLLLAIVPLVFTTTSCFLERDGDVIIYTALEDYRIDMVEEELAKKFPNYSIVVQSLSSGTLVSRLKMEGRRSQADIFVNLELTNTEMILNQNPGTFADLSEYDTSKYLPELLKYEERHHNYHIFNKESGCIILNTAVLKEHNLEEPQTYDDLLKPEYKDLIMMPNPKSSGTGYYFYKSLIASRGEEEALKYFAKLAKNVKEFSTSGSGPVKSCDRKEIAIGLGMTFQAAKYMDNNKDLKIKFFDEGSPYSLYTMGIIAGKEKNPKVKEVYDFIFNDIAFKDKKYFSPDRVYKDEYTPETVLKNFPTSIKYAEMGDMYNYEYKQELLDKWKW